MNVPTIAQCHAGATCTPCAVMHVVVWLGAAIAAVVLVSSRWICLVHWKRNRYVSAIYRGRRCEGCAEHLRVPGEPEGFHEEWIAKNWRRL